MIAAQDQFIMTVFSHDSYLMTLPSTDHNSFYAHFSFYKGLKTYSGSRITQAPIIRLFGTTNNGQKACVHVHGYFPFMYIKVEHLKEAFKNQQYLKTFLGISQNLYQEAYNYKYPVIYKGQIQEKLDFYGYHSKKQAFLKIFVYDEHQIGKLRQLYASRAINGQSLQPYNAHISYFMHFFSELNIFGLHEMLFTNFKFRKNIVGHDAFKKINTISLQNLEVSPGIDLTELFQKYPDKFSILEKSSSCYVEMDVHHDSVVNYLFNVINKSISQEECRSSFKKCQIEGEIIPSSEVRFKVQITRALNQFWFDQIDRRQKMDIYQGLSVRVDYSKNIQSLKDVEEGKQDVLWMDFSSRKQVKQLLQKYIKSYLESSKAVHSTDLTINKNVVQNYGMVIDRQITQMIESVTERWKFYSQRSKNLINSIIKGEVKQIPDWEQFSEDSDHQQEQNIDTKNKKQNQQKDKQSESQSQNLFEKMMNKQVHSGNTSQFRNNYTINRGILKTGGYFSCCKYCSAIVSECNCPMFKDIPNPLKNELKFVLGKSAKFIKVKYTIKPPTIQKVKLQSQIESQFPFFSEIEDLFDNYNVPKIYPRTKETAQLLDCQIKPLNKFINVPGLKNSQRLPSFWRVSLPHKSQRQSSFDYVRLKYTKIPPRLLDLLPRKEEVEVRKQTGFNKKQNVFSCNIALLNFEIITECKNYYSNPQSDRITGIIYSINNQICSQKRVHGAIFVSKPQNCTQSSFPGKIEDIFLVDTEKQILLLFALLVFKIDPDLLVSYDHEKRGIYYLVVRAYLYGMNYADLLSRSSRELDDLFDIVTFQNFNLIRSKYFTMSFLVGKEVLTSHNNKKGKKKLEKAMQSLENRKKTAPVLRKKYNFNVRIKGRVCINIYRIVESEKKYTCYTIQFVVKQLFGVQLPQFTDKVIYESVSKNLNFTVDYVLTRVEYLTEILQKLNVVGGLIEKSKLYGCNFESMLERGSQFKIEAIMSRVCLHSDYLLLSATKLQVSEQKYLQCRPLVLQPPKQLFVDPVLVFDFQSLYPSVMIAFNICYSTCLGNIKQLFNKQTRLKRFGVSKQSDIDLSFMEPLFENEDEKQILKRIEKYIFVTPNKVAFLRKNIKQGILPRMLFQFLMSRIMIKNSSRLYKSETIKRLLHERQAAIKLFMNVTYGYTGATFSGRMPCSQIADSIVELAKFCLTTCIKDMNDNPKYKGGSVIYGDTDSIFFHLKGKSMKEAFQIGQIIGKDMTKKFPYPIQLKFQKVYESLVLVSKKRYYGKKFQSLQGIPKYEGKGLECVRRDTVSLVSDGMAELLNNLFDKKDLSVTKKLFQDYVSRVRSGLIFPKELAFAKQVKLLKYGALLPAHGQAALKLQSVDSMLIPKYGERMKYVVLKEGLSTIKDRSLPLFLFQNEQIDNQYYISKHFLPSLQRVFTSIVSLEQWQNSAPKIHNPINKHAFSIEQCIICGHPNTQICPECIPEIDRQLKRIVNQYEQKLKNCQDCIRFKSINQSSCVEWNCTNLWERRKAEKYVKILKPQLNQLKKVVMQIQQ